VRVLITGAASRLGQAIAKELADDHELRLLDSTAIIPGGKARFIQGDLTDPDVVGEAVSGVDAIVHTGEPPLSLPEDELAREQQLLDWASRGTHVVFTCGVEAGVRRFVYGSTLEIFAAYPDDVYISEMWKPRPGLDMPAMSRYLGEVTCRTFVHGHLIGVTVLRLGRLVLEEEVTGREADLMWVDLRDAAQAFACALERDTADSAWWTQRWGLFHIAAPIPNGKYLIKPALGMGYAPQHSFAAHWQPGGGERA